MAILVILSVSSSSFRFPAFDIFNDGDGGGNNGLFFSTQRSREPFEATRKVETTTCE